jgi:hypothetical protein
MMQTLTLPAALSWTLQIEGEQIPAICFVTSSEEAAKEMMEKVTRSFETSSVHLLLNYSNVLDACYYPAVHSVESAPYLSILQVNWATPDGKHGRDRDRDYGEVR